MIKTTSTLILIKPVEGSKIHWLALPCKIDHASALLEHGARSARRDDANVALLGLAPTIYCSQGQRFTVWATVLLPLKRFPRTRLKIYACHVLFYTHPCWHCQWFFKLLVQWAERRRPFKKSGGAHLAAARVSYARETVLERVGFYLAKRVWAFPSLNDLLSRSLLEIAKTSADKKGKGKNDKETVLGPFAVTNIKRRKGDVSSF